MGSWDLTSPAAGAYSRTSHAITKAKRADGGAAEHAVYRELLGEAGHRQFIDDQKKATPREIVGAFAAQALRAGLPFSADRLDAVVEAMAGAQIPKTGWRRADGRFATLQFDPIDWDVADARVRPLLSEAEWNIDRFHTVERAGHRLRTPALQAKNADEARQKSGAARQGTGRRIVWRGIFLCSVCRVAPI